MNLAAAATHLHHHHFHPWSNYWLHRQPSFSTSLRGNPCIHTVLGGDEITTPMSLPMKISWVPSPHSLSRRKNPSKLTPGFEPSSPSSPFLRQIARRTKRPVKLHNNCGAQHYYGGRTIAPCFPPIT